MRYSIQLDIVFDDEFPFKQGVDELTRGLRVVPSVVTMQGPGGGWPLVRFASDSRKDLETVVDRYWSDDAEEAEWAKDELIEES